MTAELPFPTLPRNLTLKQRANAVFAAGVLVSVFVHLMVLSLFPNFSVAYGSRGSSMEPMLEILHEIEIPLPPDELPRPAIPILSTEIGFDPDISIAPVQFGDIPPPVRQPPASANASVGTERSWVPFEVAPTIRNRDDYLRAV